MRGIRWVFLASCLLPNLLHAQSTSPVVFPSENRELLKQHQDADRKAAEEKWTEAIDDYQRLIAESGNHLVPVTATHWVAMSWLCHSRLAALPPAGLQEYRKRSDPQARKVFERGMATRDPRLLRRVVREAFASRPAEEAIDLLGDLAFERGNFEEAEYWWRMLATPVAESVKNEEGGPLHQDQGANAPRSPRNAPAHFVYPGPSIDIARVRAKQILSQMMRSARQDWHVELETYARLHGKAEGHLAGRKGKYLDVLRSFAKQAHQVAVPPGPTDWPTFAGSPSRNRTLVLGEKERARLLRVCQTGPRWCFDLASGQVDPTVDAARLAIATAAHRPARAPATHPILVGNQAFITDSTMLWTIDLNSGHSKVLYRLGKPAPSASAKNPPMIPAEVQPSGRTHLQNQFTLTAYQDRLFVRLEPSSQEKGAEVGTKQPRAENQKEIEGRKHGAKSQNRSRLALSSQLSAFRCREPGKVDWIANLPGNDPMWFEGSPLVHQGRVYATVTEAAPTETRTIIHCYALESEADATEQAASPPADRTEQAATASLIWKKTVCTIRGRSESRPSHQLTLAGPNLVICVPEGAVCALDALSGAPVWATLCGRKASRAAPAAGHTQEVRHAPVTALYGEGRVCVAFPEARMILCLDAATGHLLWEKRDISVVDVLGLVEDRLIFTTQRGIGACHVSTGNQVRSWFQPADGTTLAPLGRGILAGGLVFWPTVQGVKVLNQADGQPADIDPTLYRHIKPGNMVYGNGYLLVADAQRLWVYAPEPGRHKVNDK